MKTDNKLGEILSERFSITSGDIKRALKFQTENGGKLGEILLNFGVISEEQIASALAIQFDIKELKEEISDIYNLKFGPLKSITPHWYIKNELVPLCTKSESMLFLILDPLNIYPMDVVTKVFVDFKVKFLIADDRKFRKILQLFKKKHLDGVEKENFEEGQIFQVNEMGRDATPNIKFVNSMLSRAAEYKASDIHVENQDNKLLIRYRIDGVLHDIDNVSLKKSAAIISRLKIMAGLDIGEKRLPQDGRIELKLTNKLFDIRLSTLPSIKGENIVLRLLPKEETDYKITTLGLEELDLVRLNNLINKTYGLILITGPTGSGKSTSLYSILTSLSTRERKIITVEDPVEYKINGITQIQVLEQIGLSFASILRNILRHDPDIIMIGEIRDRETAEIAIKSALTGHLVLATLHTNDSFSAVTRLIDLGIDEYLINSSLLGVIAQRLVRRLCPDCREELKMKSLNRGDLGILKIQDKYPDITSDFIYREKGCKKCVNTGYKGRIGVFEILEYKKKIKDYFLKYKDIDTIKKLLVDEKEIKSIREDALLKVVKGITSLQEVLRVT